MVAKLEAKRFIDTLPDDATMDQIVYALYVNMMLDEGERDIDAGRVMSQNEVEESLRKWLR